LETDGSGAALASYVLGGAELLSQTRDGTTSYYLPDGQGNIRALTDDSGYVTDTYAYSAFGEVLSRTGSTVNPYQYTSQQFDALTGLYSLRARYYDPTFGRFLSQDTYPYKFSNPVELNRYVYTANNPVNAIEPSGHDALVEYGFINQNSGEEGAVIEPVGEEFASEAERLVNEYVALINNAGNIGEGAANAIRAAKAEQAASQLVSEGLNPPNAPSLINELTRYATLNPDADIVSLGRVPYYLVRGEEGYTYFNLPGNSYEILQNAGRDFAEAVNRLSITHI